MLKIDSDLLKDLGLAELPPAVASELMRHIYETLEMRVGSELASTMSDEQLDEFERFMHANDDAGAFTWLETNFPNYKEIVVKQFEALKDEIKANAEAILASAHS